MSALQRLLLKFSVLAIMLLGLPVIGVFVANLPVDRYLEFPPQTRYVQHAPFSWSVFFILAFVIVASILPIVITGIQTYRRSVQTTAAASNGLPWWGWIGVVSGSLAWILAWTRFSWFAGLQPHTFSALWFSYTLVVNALCWRRTGRSLMTDGTWFFLFLFPASAAFWWFFEYLNRFVQNWYYIGVQFSPWAYFWYATLPFSTVLPAVLSTRQYLLSANWISRGYTDVKPIKLSRFSAAAEGVLLLSAAGLAGIGVWPNYLFPLLWVSPLLIITCLQTLMKERHIFSQMDAGNWSGAVAAALAAIFCGVFWEMWNYFSLAKWEYSIPLVHRFQIFEMPLLGYAGYLPFGLQCAAIGDMLQPLFKPLPLEI